MFQICQKVRRGFSIDQVVVSQKFKKIYVNISIIRGSGKCIRVPIDPMARFRQEIKFQFICWCDGGGKSN